MLRLRQLLAPDIGEGALKQQGWTIGAGYGALKDSTIRIGHMGDHTVAALDELLPLIGRALA